MHTYVCMYVMIKLLFTASQQVNKQSCETLLHSVEEILPTSQFIRPACPGTPEERA